MLDERKNCFVLHNYNGTAHYMNFESEEKLNELEKHWQRTLYTSVYSIGVRIIYKLCNFCPYEYNKKKSEEKT